MVSKQLQVIDGQQGRMLLDPFGAANPNNAGMVNQDGSYSNYATSAYGRNELVYACIRYRAESLPQSVLRVYPRGRGEPLENHRLRRLFAEPNPLMGEFEFFELQSTYKDLSGACFTLIVRGRDGLPSELWPLRPDLVGALPGARRGYPANSMQNFIWVYRPDPNRPEITVGIDPDDMLRVRYPNPNPNDPGYRFFGQPPLRAAARAVTLDNGATDFVDTMLRNHAIPSIVIETEQTMTSTIQDRLATSWVKAFGGPRRGYPAFLQKGMNVHVLGLNLTDLEFPDLRAVAETHICMPFGVPPILVGAKVGLEHNAYKDFREARLVFWEEAMVSEQRRWIEPVRSQLLPQFTGAGRPTIRLGWDNSDVLPLKESQQQIWDRATRAVQAGAITVNEFCMLVGLPDKGTAGDMYLTPAGVVPQPIAEDRAAVEIESKAAAIGLLAAEHGIELKPDELAMLRAQVVEGADE
jgi:HK97 family phage portal protein